MYCRCGTEKLRVEPDRATQDPAWMAIQRLVRLPSEAAVWMRPAHVPASSSLHGMDVVCTMYCRLDVGSCTACSIQLGLAAHSDTHANWRHRQLRLPSSSVRRPSRSDVVPSRSLSALCIPGQDGLGYTTRYSLSHTDKHFRSTFRPGPGGTQVSSEDCDSDSATFPARPSQGRPPVACLLYPLPVPSCRVSALTSCPSPATGRTVVAGQ